MVIEIDYSDPAVRRMLAVNEATNAAFAERMEGTTAEYTKAIDTTLKENEEELKKAEAAYAEKRRARQAPKEDPHRWPERDKRKLVMSFREDDEKPPVPTPPAPPRPRPKPPEPPQAPAPERPTKGRVLNFSTEDDEDEGFQGFRRRR